MTIHRIHKPVPPQRSEKPVAPARKAARRSVSLRRAGAHLALGLSCACSAKYSLGTLGEQAASIDGESNNDTGGPTELVDETPEPIANFGYVSASNQDLFPESMANVGDLDADGHDDWVVAGWPHIEVHYGRAEPLRTESGAAANSTPAADAKLLYEPPSFVNKVMGLGDIDGDGYDDALLLAGKSDPTKDLVEARVLYGGSRLSGDLDFSSIGVALLRPKPIERRESQNGQGVALGDLNGDGLNDFGLTAGPAGPTQTSTHYIFYGNTQRPTNGSSWQAADATLVDRTALEATSKALPWSRLRALGDMNGDGLDDVLIATGDALREGAERIYIVPGDSEHLSGKHDVQEVGSFVGSASLIPSPTLSFPGDLDRDGFDDLLIHSADMLSVLLHYGREDVFERGFDVGQPDATFHSSTARLWFPLHRRANAPLGLLVTQPRIGVPESSASIVFPAGMRWQGQVDLTDPSLERSRLPDYIDPQERSTTSYEPAGDLDGDGRDDFFTTTLRVESWSENESGRLERLGGDDVRAHIAYSDLPVGAPLR